MSWNNKEETEATSSTVQQWKTCEKYGKWENAS